MPTIYYWSKVTAPQYIVDENKEALNLLFNGEYKSLRLEKLKNWYVNGQPVYSIRDTRARRLLFTTVIDKNNTRKLVFLARLENHEYESSQFCQTASYINMDNLLEEQTELTEASFEAQNTIDGEPVLNILYHAFNMTSNEDSAPTFEPVHYDHHKYIQLDLIQQGYLKLMGSESVQSSKDAHCFILSGVPGAGKSMLATRLFAQQVTHAREQGYLSAPDLTENNGKMTDVTFASTGASSSSSSSSTPHEPLKTALPRLLYIARSEGLVDVMKQNWRAQPESIDLPEGMISFLSYHAFLQEQLNLTQKKVTLLTDDLVETKAGTLRQRELNFKTWYEYQLKTNRALKNRTFFKNYSAVYQEMLIRAGCESDEAYQQLGQGQSALAGKLEDSKQLSQLFKLYRAYLVKQNQLDSLLCNVQDIQTLYNVPTTPIAKPYTLVFIDESQDLPSAPLDSIRHCAQHQRTAGPATTFLLARDTHQTVGQDLQISNLNMIKQKFPGAINLGLKLSHRCPPGIVKLANTVIDLKYRCTGGKADSDEYTSMLAQDLPHDEDEAETKPLWHEQLPNMEDLRAKLAGNPDIAIVTRPELKHVLQRALNHPLVFTVAEIKGLEYPRVILYDLLSHKHYVEASQILQQQTSKTGAIHKPKQKSDLVSKAPLAKAFNELFTAMTRATEQLEIYQPTTDAQLEALLTPLKTQCHVVAPSASDSTMTKSMLPPISSSPVSYPQPLISSAASSTPRLESHQTPEVRGKKPQHQRCNSQHKAKRGPQATQSSATSSTAAHASSTTARSPATSSAQATSSTAPQQPCLLPIDIQIKWVTQMNQLIQSQRLDEARAIWENTLRRQDNFEGYLRTKQQHSDGKVRIASGKAAPLTREHSTASSSQGIAASRTQNLKKRYNNRHSRRNAAIEARETEAFIWPCEPDDTQLHRLAASGDIEGVTQWLKWDNRVDTTNKKGMTPLHYACINGHTAIIELLIHHGANKNALYREDKRVISPIIAAIVFRKVECVQTLLRLGAEMHSDSMHPMNIAIMRNEPQVIPVLLAYLDDRDVGKANYSNLLNCAVDAAHPNVIDVLTSKEVVTRFFPAHLRPFNTATDGPTPEPSSAEATMQLLLALQKGDLAQAAYLLSLGTRTHYIDQNIEIDVLSMFANKPGNDRTAIAAMKLLIHHGADVSYSLEPYSSTSNKQTTDQPVNDTPTQPTAVLSGTTMKDHIANAISMQRVNALKILLPQFIAQTAHIQQEYHELFKQAIDTGNPKLITLLTLKKFVARAFAPKNRANTSSGSFSTIVNDNSSSLSTSANAVKQLHLACKHFDFFNMLVLLSSGTPCNHTDINDPLLDPLGIIATTSPINAKALAGILLLLSHGADLQQSKQRLEQRGNKAAAELLSYIALNHKLPVLSQATEQAYNASIARLGDDTVIIKTCLDDAEKDSIRDFLLDVKRENLTNLSVCKMTLYAAETTSHSCEALLPIRSSADNILRTSKK